MPTVANRSKQRLTPEQQAEHDQRITDDFNRAHPVGSPCWYWVSLPFGPVRETRVRTAAMVACCGHHVCFVDGVAGYVSIWHVTEPKEAQREHVSFVSVPCPVDCPA
jgi:hypothetical protein